MSDAIISDDSAIPSQEQNTTLTKQPKALRVLFMTEMWERFAYWSVQSLLVLYMTKSLMLVDARAFVIFAAFNALLLAAPVLGGFVADRYLGFRSSINVGAVLLACGYFVLVLQSTMGFILLSIVCILLFLYFGLKQTYM